MKNVTLSANEKAILDKLTIKQLRDNAEVSEKYLQTIVDISNLLLDNEKEWFLLDQEPSEKELAKKHYALRQNMAVLKKLIRIVQASRQKLELIDNKKSAK